MTLEKIYIEKSDTIPIRRIEKSKVLPDAIFSALLKAFSVNDGGTRFIILLLGNPHLLGGGPSDPHRVFTLRRSNNLDLHCGWSQSRDFLLHSVSDSWEYGGATSQHYVGVQVLTDIHITLHDGIVCGLMAAVGFYSTESGLEHDF